MPQKVADGVAKIQEKAKENGLKNVGKIMKDNTNIADKGKDSSTGIFKNALKFLKVTGAFGLRFIKGETDIAGDIIEKLAQPKPKEVTEQEKKDLKEWNEK